MIDKKTMEVMLGISDDVLLDAKRMAEKLVFTIYPDHGQVEPELEIFFDDFCGTLKKLGARFVDYESAITKKSYLKILRKSFLALISNMLFIFERIFNVKSDRVYYNLDSFKFILQTKILKENIQVLVKGELKTDDLPIRLVRSFKYNSVIYFLDWPQTISVNSNFNEHFDKAMELFAKNMANLVVAVSKDNWLLYNFNASHPIYSRIDPLDVPILKSFIPKVFAPITPLKFDAFTYIKDGFSPELMKDYINDFIESGKIFERKEIFPKGKKVADLPFRNPFFKWIGKMHLDNRNGMSFGFLARQLPTRLTCPVHIDDVNNLTSDLSVKDQKWFFIDKQLYVRFQYNKKDYFLEVPEVWILTQRSGSNKTRPNPQSDLILMGLVNGELFLRPPQDFVLNSDYKPSFDSHAIVAHALGNAVIASVLKYLVNEEHPFVRQVEEKGLGICHWHGYLNEKHIPNGIMSHGLSNLPVACSSPQSAIYALGGKLDYFFDEVLNNDELIKTYQGDVHIEPQHGSNMNYRDLVSIAEFLTVKEVTELGNKYLKYK